MLRVSPLVALLSVSSLIHLAGFGGVAMWLSGQEATPADKASIRIALGSSGARAGAEAQTEHVEAQKEPQQKPKPKPAPDPLPVPKQPQRPLPKPIPTPVPKPEPRAEMEVSSPPPAPHTSMAALAGEQGQSGASSEHLIDTEGETDEEGYQALLVSHDGLVLGHLSRFKSFPPRARMRGEEGEVAVEFEIARDGRLLSCRILSSAGSRYLDAAALSQMRKADPYPAAPAEAQWQTRTYHSVMRYSLRE